MAEFIGARISLISNSDIRYVGTLHEINSETSTVALENVSMLGTEGRRPENEVAPLESIYEYILFRGTDVKDLRIEEAPTKDIKPPPVPDDPAILGSRSRPAPLNKTVARHQHHQNSPLPSQSLQSQTSKQEPQEIPQNVLPSSHYNQQPQYPQYYPQAPGWARGAPPGTTGLPPVGYVNSASWFAGPQQVYPPGHFPPYGYSTGLPLQYPPPQSTINGKPHPIGSGPSKQEISPTLNPVKQNVITTEPKNAPKAAEMPAAPVRKASTSPMSAKVPNEKKKINTESSNMASLNGHRNNYRVQPALPLPNLTSNKETAPTKFANKAARPQTDLSNSLRDATQAASAAVAAAMANLPQTNENAGPVDNLTKKVNEMRITDPNRVPRHNNGSNPNTGKMSRGNNKNTTTKGGSKVFAPKIEVPKEDFDFESSNAKFSKHDLVKESKSNPSVGDNLPSETLLDKKLPVIYNKATSFFDNISSEAKDRQEAHINKHGGREWRGEEQKKNLETFGQESIDNSYRGGYRGRGGGRGGYRGRGYSGSNHSSRGREGR